MLSSDLSTDEEKMYSEEELSSEQNSEENNSDGYSSCSDEEEDPNSSSKLKLADDDFRQMPFEDLLQLKRRLGSKVYNEAVFGKESKNISTDLVKNSGKNKNKRALHKDSDSDGPPEELSAKRKVPALGMDKSRLKKEQSRFRDPRFDAKQGYFSGRKFREQYGFLNDLRTDELKTLKKQVEETEDPDETERLKFAVRRTENQILEFNKQKVQDKKRKEEKLQTRKAIDEGKRPFYEKNSTKKARELVEKYDKLTEEGKIGKHIDKRKRKITAKDRKKLDFST
ncbi:ribosomal RNA processing protein 36 homolog [Ochlerotatus camptorhynchus]|uniref:ribosomal RNA processing protein 36 homolog n=1 Tax=Ochlerotatus camptorhynchus TaxID=644619 RepID=UPI0031E15389